MSVKTKMRAVQLHGKGDVRFAEVAKPETPRQGDVLLAVEAAGICGSDIHNFRTGQWISRAPSIPGHEFCANVVAIGPDVRNLAVGDRVVADSRYWCGACESCIAGNPHLCRKLGFVGEICDGGFAEWTVLPERLLFKIDQSLDSAVAATAEPLAVALHALMRLAPQQDQPVLVTGCGMIGALCALVLSHRKIGPLRIADRNHMRAARVAQVTGAQIVAVDEAGLSGVAGVIEATGSTAVLNALITQMGGGGRIALVGIFHGAMEIDPTLLVERELDLIGCHAFRDEFPGAVALLPALAMGITGLIGEPIKLEHVPDAYRRIIAGEVDDPKTIVQP